MTSRAAKVAPGDVSIEIRRGLVDSLFDDSQSMTTGCLATCASCAAVAGHMHSVAAQLITFAALVVTGVRLYVARRHQARVRDRTELDLRKTEHIYISGVCAYLLCLGMLAFVAFACGGDAFSLCITVFIAITNATGIAVRNYAIRYGVGLQIAAIGLPLAAGIMMRGGIFWLLLPMHALLCSFVYSSSARLRNTLLSEMTYRRRSDTIAARFRLAIDNMSHGIGMINDEMRIVVSNGKLAECFGLSEKRPLQGVRFASLVRLGRRRQALSQLDAERLMTSFNSAVAFDDVVRLEMSGASGQVHELALRRNDEGGWVLVVQDVTVERRARAALDRAAHFDAMSGLPNRATFEARLVESLHAARKLGMRTEILFLDLDLFKQVNDTLGHKIGDRVIAESANRLSQAVGPDGFAARWGGDEFVVLRRGSNDAAVIACAERLIAELSRPMWIEGAEIKVGASAGVAVCGDGRTSMETLLQHADLALYTAKREARGACRLFENAMNDKARERRLLELDTQAALAARSFELRYQPIVDLETGDLVSFEALAAWRHPTRGSVSPVVFIQVLEELNLMQVFGAWALNRACEDAAKWPQPVRVGVNVSAKQIDTLVEAVKRALDASGLPPQRLELEITETAALAGGDEARRALEAVRAMGVRVALDDFGTGFSSLSHLMSLPLDKVKIDKSFTQELGLSRKADVVVANIARLSSQLGMRVTFEGVETEAQLELVRAVGVPAEGQGWLFGRPTDNADLGRFFTVVTGKQAVA